MITLLLVALFSAYLGFGRACEVRAKVETGSLCGTQQTLAGSTYALFYNVPYAEQPLGELRFKELQKAKPWEGDHDATKLGHSCPQVDKMFGMLILPANMSEDCIHANIYAPKETIGSATAKLPVLVFIHGGAFEAGSGDPDAYGPQYFIQYSPKKIVLITFNYRLDVLGFMSLNSPEMPGNNGLRDQITLLKWVQRNVKNFGGDPDNVTLMGQSAGAASVHLLSLSAAAEGLFKRIIIASGTAIPTWYGDSQAYAQSVTKALLSQLQITSTDPAEIHNELVALPIDKLLSAYNKIQDATGISSFAPIVESSFPGITRIIDDDTVTLLKKGRGKNIPAIVGFTSAETNPFRPRFKQLGTLDAINADNTKALFLNVLHALSYSEALELAKKVISHYSDGTLNFEQLVEFTSDAFFAYPSMKAAQLRAAAGAETYLYQFSYEGEYRVIPVALSLNYSGVGHVEDITYVYRLNLMFEDGVKYTTPNDDKMKVWMLDFITNFMTSGTPTSAANWPALKPGPVQYLDIHSPGKYVYTAATEKQTSMFSLYDTVFNSID